MTLNKESTYNMPYSSCNYFRNIQTSTRPKQQSTTALRNTKSNGSMEISQITGDIVISSHCEMKILKASGHTMAKLSAVRCNNHTTVKTTAVAQYKREQSLEITLMVLRDIPRG